MSWLSPGRMLAAFEAWVTGYRSEHFKLGLQMGMALIIGLLPVLIDRWYNTLDKGGSSLYTAVTVAVVLEPSTGDAFRKIAKRLLGAGLAGGLGMLVLFWAIGDDQYNPKFELDGSQTILAKWTVPASAILGFVFMVNRQRFWRHHEFWATALFTLPIVMLPAIRSLPANYYRGAAYRMINVCLGIVIAAVVSFVLFPVRARGLLQKKMASSLIKIGDLAVWIVGQVCVLPQPGSNQNIPGASDTDDTFTYRDDGLHAKMQPLMETASELTADLAYMGKVRACCAC
jgi:uncharacterized membrane protein YccC